MKSQSRSADRQRSRSLSRPAALWGIAALLASSVTAVAAPGAAVAAPANTFSHGAFETGVTATEPPAVAGNLLPDGRFVSDLAGWTAPRGGTLALGDDAASGAHALTVTGRENTQSGPFASVADKIELGATYRLTGSLRYDEGAPTQQFNFTFCPTNFNGCADYGHTFTKGEWGTFSQEFTAEAKHVAAGWLFVETPWGSAALQDFSVDDVSLVKIADAPEAPAFTSLEKVQTKPIGDHNPLVGHKFGADPHHLVYNGRLYIYSTDDTQQYDLNSKDENGLPTQSNGYGGITRLNVMSTTDMVNWVDHGAVPIAREGGAAPWSRNSWAPAAIEKDGKVYLYFCDNGTVPRSSSAALRWARGRTRSARRSFPTRSPATTSPEADSPPACGCSTPRSSSTTTDRATCTSAATRRSAPRRTCRVRRTRSRRVSPS